MVQLRGVGKSLSLGQVHAHNCMYAYVFVFALCHRPAHNCMSPCVFLSASCLWPVEYVSAHVVVLAMLQIVKAR